MNIIKARYKKSDKAVSLKEFARQLRADGDLDAKGWFENKSRRLEKIAKKARLERKGSILAAMRNAKKSIGVKKK